MNDSFTQSFFYEKNTNVPAIIVINASEHVAASYIDISFSALDGFKKAQDWLVLNRNLIKRYQNREIDSAELCQSIIKL